MGNRRKEEEEEEKKKKNIAVSVLTDIHRDVSLSVNNSNNHMAVTQLNY